MKGQFVESLTELR